MTERLKLLGSWEELKGTQLSLEYMLTCWQGWHGTKKKKLKLYKYFDLSITTNNEFSHARFVYEAGTI